MSSARRIRNDDVAGLPTAGDGLAGLRLLYVLGERFHEGVVELGGLDRLRQLHGELSGRPSLGQPAERGEQDERKLALVSMPPDLACEREPVHLRHHHVEDGDVERLAFLDPSERLGGGRDRHGLHAPRSRVASHDLAVRGVVVDDEDPLAGELRQRRSARPREPAPPPLPRARPMWKVDPLPSSLSTHIVPPISSTRRFEIASPSPVPP